MPTPSTSPPWFDPQLRDVLRALPSVVTTLRPTGIAELRALGDATLATDEALSGGGVRDVSTILIAGPVGAPEIELLLVRPAQQRVATPGPVIFSVHGGGMVAGSNRELHAFVLEAVGALGATVVSPSYRLAPEAPYPAALDDVYAALSWTVAHAVDLGIDSKRLVLVGASAGGGLAAGTALLARDRGGPGLAGQMLIYPMLDDRMRMPSSVALDGIGVWDKTSNFTGWSALLGNRAGADDVPAYAAPARAADLSGLPRAYLDAGTAETFRDEAVEYALRLNQAGVPTDLHIWAGGFHGFDQFVPDAALSRQATATRLGYLRRLLTD